MPRTVSAMGRRIELGLVWSGLFWAVMFFIGILIAGWLPLPAANDSAAEVAAMYREDHGRILAGLVIIFASTVGFLFYAAALASTCRRITGAPAAVRYVQVGAIGAMTVFIIGPIMFWFAAAYRPEQRSAEMLQTLNDLGWISFLTAFVPFVAWVWSVGLAIFCDDSPEPIYPRWAAYLCMLLGTLQAPAVLLVFFKTGPFAWNNLFAWWLPATDFFIFMIVMLVLTVKALRAEGRGIGAMSPGGAPAADDAAAGGVSVAGRAPAAAR